MDKREPYDKQWFKTGIPLFLVGCGVIFLFCGVLVIKSASANFTSAPSLKTNWFVDMNRFSKSAHARFKCEECHGSMLENARARSKSTKADLLKRDAVESFDYSCCRKCHKKAYGRYRKGGHAKALEKENKNTDAAVKKKNKKAPRCGDCHSAHYGLSGSTRLEIGRQMVETCSRCHVEHAQSYMDNIHGKLGVNLGETSAAFCTDCHGAHMVKKLDKPEDTLTVCLRCHREAEKHFTGYVVHASISDETIRDASKKESIIWLQRIKLIAIIIVAVSLLFFFGHSILWVLRELHEKLRKQ